MHNAKKILDKLPRFKQYLVGNTLINTNGDSEIQLSEATAFNGTIEINTDPVTVGPGAPAFDVTGLEAFTALTKLVLIPYYPNTPIGYL